MKPLYCPQRCMNCMKQILICQWKSPEREREWKSFRCIYECLWQQQFLQVLSMALEVQECVSIEHRLFKEGWARLSQFSNSCRTNFSRIWIMEVLLSFICELYMDTCKWCVTYSYRFLPRHSNRIEKRMIRQHVLAWSYWEARLLLDATTSTISGSISMEQTVVQSEFRQSGKKCNIIFDQAVSALLRFVWCVASMQRASETRTIWRVNTDLYVSLSSRICMQVACPSSKSLT